ncbi:hypothetical protein B484DRAFT_455551 [Ochromonadaceae sp. CCMP2298]|nr:hypothetical protein B484DRAFT_455551 [Ochromonadaceae sp. CCMP2298]
MELTVKNDYTSAEAEEGHVGKVDAQTKHLETEGWNSGNCYGLKSENETTRTRAIASWSVCFLASVGIALIIIFLAIIPAVIQTRVDETDIIISKAIIIKPGNESFNSEVYQEMYHKGPKQHGYIQFNTLTINWAGMDMVDMTDNNYLNLADDMHTLKSAATVVDTHALTAFNNFAVVMDECFWFISGSATVKTSTGLQVPVKIKDKKTTLNGFNNFIIPPVVNTVMINGGDASRMFSSITGTMKMTSNIELQFGQTLYYYVKYMGVNVGIGSLSNFNLETGTFDIASDIDLGIGGADSPGYAELMMLVTEFVSQRDAPIEMGPFWLANPVNWLTPSLSIITMASILPALKESEKLLTQISMYPPTYPSPGGSFGEPLTIPFFLYVLNPIDADFRLTSVKAKVFSGDTKIHIANVDQTLDYTVSPKTTSLSPLLNANSIISQVALGETARIKAIKWAYLTLETTITGFIGDYPIATSYNQVAYTWIYPTGSPASDDTPATGLGGVPPSSIPPSPNPNPCYNPTWLDPVPAPGDSVCTDATLA